MRGDISFVDLADFCIIRPKMVLRDKQMYAILNDVANFWQYVLVDDAIFHKAELK